jgi:hypothetical protein
MIESIGASQGVGSNITRSRTLVKVERTARMLVIALLTRNIKSYNNKWRAFCPAGCLLVLHPILPKVEVPELSCGLP